MKNENLKWLSLSNDSANEEGSSRVARLVMLKCLFEGCVYYFEIVK